MRRLVFAVVLVLVGSCTFAAQPAITTIADMVIAVRFQTNIKSTVSLPDSQLIQFVSRGLVYTSIDIGGVETHVMLTTDTLQHFYAVPDSITKIVSATLISEGVTKSIKAWPAQYFEGHFDVTSLTGDEEDQFPQGYNMWGDSVQLTPSPAKVDSIFLKVLVEHRALIVAADDSIKIQFGDGYKEAALFYICGLIFTRSKMYEDATFYFSLYEKRKTELLEDYAKGFDIALRDEQ